MSTTDTAETRRDAAGALGAMSSAAHPEKTGLMQKVAIAGTIYRLARRYPVAALVVGSIALAVYMARRKAHGGYVRH
jgi:hypothetical protein